MITAYVKPTNRCNVGCTHCYLPEAVRADRTRMSDETLASTGRFLAEMLSHGRHAGVHVLWHGGEPLVLPAEWYYKAQEILDGFVPHRTESMQTSLIPLREEHVALLRDRLGGFVGSSVDFSQRMIQGSVERYHALWMKKVDMARAGGVEVIPGVVPTIREMGREADIVQWFVDRDFPAFNIDRYNAYGSSFPDRPSNLQHSSILEGFFDALMDLMERTGSAPVVGAIRASITGVLFGIGGDRWGGSCTSDFVVVEPDGSLNNCPDKASFEEPFGKVSEGYAAYAASRFRRKWIRHQALTHKMDYCSGCENLHFCKSGCPITPNGPAEGEDGCSGYRPYLSHVRARLSSPAARDVAIAYLEQSRRNKMLESATNYGGEKGMCAA